MKCKMCQVSITNYNNRNLTQERLCFECRKEITLEFQKLLEVKFEH